MFRNDKFTGERGKYNSVFNELVRQLGKSNVKQLQQYNKNEYNELCNDVLELAKEKELLGEDIIPPKVRDIAFYGMTSERKKILKKNKKDRVGLYES